MCNYLCMLYSLRRLALKKNVGVVTGSSRFVLATVVGLNHGQSNLMAYNPLTSKLQFAYKIFQTKSFFFMSVIFFFFYIPVSNLRTTHCISLTEF